MQEWIRPNGTVVYSASIFPGRCLATRGGDIPWNYLGGSVVKWLEKALEGGKEISLEPAEDGDWRLAIELGDGATAVAVLDPWRGYLPIRQEILGPGGPRRQEAIAFREIFSGVWFPSAVTTVGPPHMVRSSAPRLRFTNVVINDPQFEHLLRPQLPKGSTVLDVVRGARYAIDRRMGSEPAGEAPPLPAEETAQAAFDARYVLTAEQSLKRIGPALPTGRRRAIADDLRKQAFGPEGAVSNTIYVLEWNDDGAPTVRHTGAGFLTLGEILHRVCDLDIFEYSGPEHLLGLRLSGDWLVRRGASREARLRALEPIVYEATGMHIAFEKRCVETPVVRATGILRYQALPGARGETDVQLFAEPSANDVRTYTGAGCGSLAQLLRHVAARSGRRFVDNTLSSEVDVSWSDYQSAKLEPYGRPRPLYRRDLKHLLANVARQTGLAFTQERRTIDEWVVGVKR